MLLNYPSKSKRTIPHFVPSYEDGSITVMVDKEIKFGDDTIKVAVAHSVPSVHPIPPEVTVDLFDVEHLQEDAKPVTVPLLSPSSPESIYNSYSNMLDKIHVEHLKFQDRLKSLQPKEPKQEPKQDPKPKTE